MKRLLLIAAASILLASCGNDDYERGLPAPDRNQMAERVNGRIVVAYATYYGTLTPDASCFTHLNYAFAEPYMENGEYVGLGLQGDEARFQSIVNLKKKHPELKICISFTNAKEDTRGGCFSQLAKSEKFRKEFAADCKKFVQKWGIDGVDMDWEFPGLSWSGEADAYDVAVDVDNHIKLMQELRAVLGNDYLLTYAGYCLGKTAVEGGYRYIDIAAVNPYVDFVNIMTYDLDAAPAHQSALDNPSAYSDCKRAVQTYLDAGMPANKLVLGIPFYARHSFSASPTSINYGKFNTLNTQDYKIDNWDADASVPYITYKGTYYAGYDNERSIAIKGDWILEKGMAGMMYWDYDGDDSKGTLRKAVWNAVMKK